MIFTIVLGLVLWRKRFNKRAEEKKLEENKDENPVYGTYSRGWDGEGDYGDGDVMEMSDRNSMYGY